MALLDSEALILRSYNLAEADKIIVSLSRSAGLLRGVAKGSRKLKNRFGASLEPFTLVNLTWYEKENQELVSIRQTEILRSYFKLSCDANVVNSLAYMGDLLIEFSPPRQANDTLFRMVAACLEAIAGSPADLESIVRYFEVWLLKIEGFLPDLKRCPDCLRVFGAEAVYMGNDLALRCRDCSQGRGGTISKSLHAHLRNTESLAPARFAETARDVSGITKRELGELTHQLIGRVLERLPRVRPTFVQ
jgi:DNA repair protein RecO (recombination protein O)